MIKVEIKKLENSEVEITGAIPAEIFDTHREQAIKNLGENIELQGFRKGHVPEDILEKHLGEPAILEEMAEITIGKEYKNIVRDNDLNPISRPNIAITKVAMGNPLEFKATITVMPQIVVGDYKKIAKEVYAKDEEVTVSEQELEETLTEIRTMHAKQAEQTKKKDSDVKKGEGEEEKPELPELNDEFVKGLGDFKDVADFKKKLKENIRSEKEQKEVDKKRINMMEKILNDSKVELPRVIIDAELNKMIAQFRSDVEKMGMSFEDYIKNSKKTEEDIRKEFEKEAKKKASFQLILNKISTEEKLIADKKEVAAQVATLMKQYPKAQEENVRVYVESNLLNQKVFDFLEEQK
ncbi:MAG: hypothetical protein KAR24_01970 [Candidatus Pacebacteria bacterium]|nr:hypothetical protein [Candidatus Paceibacterota bacterium]